MPSILNNVTAMAASRQIGITKMGLTQAIERLTTGKRINRASDDAAGMAAGNTAEASARSSAAAVKGHQVAYFQAQASDGAYEEATNLSYRLAELEGSGNKTSSEYTTVLGAVNAIATGGTAATDSASALAKIATARQGFAATMSSEQSGANLAGITAENQFAISDTWMGADIGAEMVNLTKYQIMMQAGTSALSNANQSSQTILGLFR
jgi:flagellin